MDQNRCNIVQNRMNIWNIIGGIYGPELEEYMDQIRRNIWTSIGGIFEPLKEDYLKQNRQNIWTSIGGMHGQEWE